jgi:NAD(P)-dependent dehydrogenase (short-subunit alcohol dehydrogenase family)
MAEYSGRTAVVTGAGSGLGAAMADLFAGEGANAALLDIDGERAEAKAAELRGRGTQAISAKVDVADSASVAAAAEAVRAKFGACEVLCANVGVQQFGAVEKLTEQDWSWVLSVNVMGVINTVAAFLPLLRQGKGERHIVLTASAACFQPSVRMAAYAATKYAVQGYGEVLRRELAEEGIHVALVFPAGMMTRHLESSRLARPQELGESVLNPDDIQAMMAAAVMEETNYVATAEHAVRNLLADLRAKEPYIFTHGNYKDQIEERHHQVIAAFDRMLAS